jgi:two-component system chemotaxis response regulator CheB
MMEERRSLLTRLGEEDLRKGLTRIGNSHKKRASDLEHHIEKLKELLFAAKKD